MRKGFIINRQREGERRCGQRQAEAAGDPDWCRGEGGQAELED